MDTVRVRRFEGLQDYTHLYQQMRDFTDTRDAETVDQIWLLQHHPVYTLGQAGKAEHLLHTSNIPLVKTDRGGQMTYHGPGQLIVYVLLDLQRRQLGVRQLVTLLEQSIIHLLAEYDIHSYAHKSAPGVYVMHNEQEHKIAALGLRVRKGRCYHGLALNMDMDLAPFNNINPCGYAGLAVTQMRDLLPQAVNGQEIENKLIQQLKNHLH